MLRNPAEKIMTLEQAISWREHLRITGRRLVVTNGCFDILHRGHAQYLLESRNLGDTQLILLNSEASVRALKGPARPIIDQFNRAYLLASLTAVNAVVAFDAPICAAELRALAPDIYVKGGDYTREKLNPDECAALDAGGTEIHFIPFVEGFSTTDIIARIMSAESC